MSGWELMRGLRISGPRLHVHLEHLEEANLVEGAWEDELPPDLTNPPAPLASGFRCLFYRLTAEGRTVRLAEVARRPGWLVKLVQKLAQLL